MRVLHVCQYAASYGGNFIKTLERLSLHLKNNGNDIAFVFVASARYKDWMRKFSSDNKVYFVSDEISKKTTSELKSIFTEYAPTIIHSHFDGFDIPIVKANVVEAKLPTVRFFKNEDSSSLLELMKSVLDNADYSFNDKSFGISREIIDEKYSIDVWCANVYKFYTEIV